MTRFASIITRWKTSEINWTCLTPTTRPMLFWNHLILVNHMDLSSFPSHCPLVGDDIDFIARHACCLATIRFIGAGFPRRQVVSQWQTVILDCLCSLLSCKDDELISLQFCVIRTSFTKAPRWTPNVHAKNTSWPTLMMLVWKSHNTTKKILFFQEVNVRS